MAGPKKHSLHWHLSKTLPALRAKRGMSQKELAGLMGLTVSALSRVERGNRLPSLVPLLRAACALGVTVERICYGGSDD